MNEKTNTPDIKKPTDRIDNSETLLEEIDENALAELNPQLADVIKTIQAEKLGKEEVAWSDFSQHNKSEAFM